VNQLEVKRAGLDDLAVGDVLDVDLARELVLVELGARHRHRQRSAVDRRRVVHAELAQQEGQAAEVVLVAVRDDDRLDVRDAAAQVGEVGQDEVDAHHLGRGEAQADVDEDDAVLVLDDGHVLADLPQAAEGKDAQRSGTQPEAAEDRGWLGVGSRVGVDRLRTLRAGSFGEQPIRAGEGSRRRDAARFGGFRFKLWLRRAGRAR
jgi:hypothetical protein